MIKAVATLKADAIKGVVKFEQSVNGGLTTINVDLSGVPTGKHGFHIHEFGDLSNGCISAGAHFNPFGTTHGDVTDNDNNKHMGDLGNVIADENGNVKTTIVCNISLIGQYSIIGRALMLHANVDDLGKGGDEESKKTGNAGARIACAVIGIAKNV